LIFRLDRSCVRIKPTRSCPPAWARRASPLYGGASFAVLDAAFDADSQYPFVSRMFDRAAGGYLELQVVDHEARRGRDWRIAATAEDDYPWSQRPIVATGSVEYWMPSGAVASHAGLASPSSSIDVNLSLPGRSAVPSQWGAAIEPTRLPRCAKRWSERRLGHFFLSLGQD